MFIRISAELTPFWVFLYRNGNKQLQITLGRYGLAKDELTLAQAKDKAAELRLLRKKGYDPRIEVGLKRSRQVDTFDSLAQRWLENDCSKLENPQIPARVYEKEIKKRLGTMHIENITGIDIQETIQAVVDSGRLSIANDTLFYLKQIFAFGIRLGVSNSNPASVFNNKNAGGTEKPRTRFLSVDEIEVVFRVFRENKNHFVEENYITLSLLLLLGVRKTELTQARWEEFNLEKQH